MPMNFEDFSISVADLPFGKKVRGDLYIHIDCLPLCPEGIRELVDKLRSAGLAGPEFNVIKFSPLSFKISFLSYPDFHEKPHPGLRSSVTVDVRSGKATRHDYAQSDNPPILHRKETLLPVGHPFAEKYEILTREEESHGLYNTGRIIGFKRNWESLLAEKGLGYVRHKLVVIGESAEPRSEDSAVEVLRHKTAIARYSFSRPVKTLLEHGMITQSMKLLDYGCGQGDDVNGLRELGYEAWGWDPVYHPDGPKKPADVVNLGFVLNVIEDPLERTAVLRDAYDLSKKLLVVFTLVATSSTATMGRPYKDGILTGRNTFQKYFRQDELEHYIEDVLNTPAVAVGLGIFYVFRSPSDQQEFLAKRSKRSVNWLELARKIRQPKLEKHRPGRPDLYERNAQLLDSFWNKMLELGRIPTTEEFDRWDDLRKEIGSASRARNILAKRFGEEALKRAFEMRRNDLQVYLALSRFKGKVPWNHLPQGLRVDIKTFLGGYRRAMEQSQALLFSAGNPDLIAKLCDETPFGVLDHKALYIHRSLVEELHPVLRIYVGCAEVLCGDLRDVDIIKIHKRSGKVSLLRYDDFEGNPLPELLQRIKVNLKRQSVDIFDHRSYGKQDVLYFKERYTAPRPLSIISSPHPQ